MEECCLLQVSRPREEDGEEEEIEEEMEEKEEEEEDVEENVDVSKRVDRGLPGSWERREGGVYGQIKITPFTRGLISIE